MADDTGIEALLAQRERVIPSPPLRTEPRGCSLCEVRLVLCVRGPAEVSMPISLLMRGCCSRCLGWLVREEASLVAGHLVFRKQNPHAWR